MQRVLITLFLTAVCVRIPAAQSAAPEDALLDIMVWGAYAIGKVDIAAYAQPIRAELEAHIRRANAFRSARPVPAGSEMRMVHSAQVAYERRLVATTADASAAARAAAYVDALKPCYEWEGFAECPQREALFADSYLESSPKDPFSAYLPLLSAHRWICAAEGFDYENKPEDAARSRRTFENRLSMAQRSSSLLVRTAAARLMSRATCRP